MFIVCEIKTIARCNPFRAALSRWRQSVIICGNGRSVGEQLRAVHYELRRDRHICRWAHGWPKVIGACTGELLHVRRARLPGPAAYNWGLVFLVLALELPDYRFFAAAGDVDVRAIAHHKVATFAFYILGYFVEVCHVGMMHAGKGVFFQEFLYFFERTRDHQLLLVL